MIRHGNHISAHMQGKASYVNCLSHNRSSMGKRIDDFRTIALSLSYFTCIVHIVLYYKVHCRNNIHYSACTNLYF